MHTCPLCYSKTKIFHNDDKRKYYKCDICNLISVPKQYHLSDSEEKQRYTLHQNSLEDTGYLTFLMNSFIPILTISTNKSIILDFGSGPNPVLFQLLKIFGLNAFHYDLHFHQDFSVFNYRYDIIVATEVIEHCKDLSQTIFTLFNLLKPNGNLIIQTSFFSNSIDFTSWSYKNDPTHINFLSHECFLWIKKKIDSTISFPDYNVVILKNKNGKLLNELKKQNNNKKSSSAGKV
jgi:hypothetical protein